MITFGGKTFPLELLINYDVLKEVLKAINEMNIEVNNQINGFSTQLKEKDKQIEDLTQKCNDHDKKFEEMNDKIKELEKLCKDGHGRGHRRGRDYDSQENKPDDNKINQVDNEEKKEPTLSCDVISNSTTKEMFDDIKTIKMDHPNEEVTVSCENKLIDKCLNVRNPEKAIVCYGRSIGKHNKCCYFKGKDQNDKTKRFCFPRNKTEFKELEEFKEYVEELNVFVLE